jgi:hypothetical protein
MVSVDGLRFPTHGTFKPFLGMRTSAPGRLTGSASHATLLGRVIPSPSLLVPLGMRVSELRAFLERISRSPEHR